MRSTVFHFDYVRLWFWDAFLISTNFIPLFRNAMCHVLGAQRMPGDRHNALCVPHYSKGLFNFRPPFSESPEPRNATKWCHSTPQDLLDLLDSVFINFPSSSILPSISMTNLWTSGCSQGPNVVFRQEGRSTAHAQVLRCNHFTAHNSRAPFRRQTNQKSDYNWQTKWNFFFYQYSLFEWINFLVLNIDTAIFSVPFNSIFIMFSFPFAI